MTDHPTILNTTLYESSGVWDVIHRLIPATEKITDVRIRYLLKPTKQSSRKIKRKTWVIVERPWQQIGASGRGPGEHLKIALLHPDKLDLPDMVVLARAVSDEINEAHSQIIEDLIDEVSQIFETPNLGKLAHNSSLKIQMREKISSEERKLAAFRTFKEQVESKRSTLMSRKRTLIHATMRRDTAQKQIADLETKIPELELKQKSLESELKRRTADILKRN